jgi:hypothetical protein
MPQARMHTHSGLLFWLLGVLLKNCQELNGRLTMYNTHGTLSA